MIFEVRVAQVVYERANERFGSGRTSAGSPSEYDVVSGPLAAAAFACRGFEELPFDVVPAVRTDTVVDPVLGAVVFAGVLLADGIVEIADFTDDPGSWDRIQEEPE